MRLVEVEKRDIYITMEFSLKEIQMLKALSDKAVIDYDNSDPLMVEAVEFLHNIVEPQLEEFRKAFFGDDNVPS